jgi:RNA polymerase primary sigma factor
VSQENAPISEKDILDRYMRAIGATPLLSPEEELALAQKVRAGEAPARDRMIRSNLKLVVKIAYDYVGMGVPLVDLISEGNLGLIKAVERFDPNRGGRLAAYAAWWIRQFIKKALADQTKMMRLPLHMVEKIARLRRAANEITAKEGREPTDEELSRATHFSQKRIMQLRGLSNPARSLETAPPFAVPLEQTLGDENALSPMEELYTKATAKRVHDILSQMDEREATVLGRRYGLDGKTAATLDEIGAELGLTRERVRQLEMEAVAHFRRRLDEDDRPLTKKEVLRKEREKAKLEVLRQFMVEKGLL